MRASPEQHYTAPPAPNCLSTNAFIPNELSYQDVHQQLTLLTIVYVRGLQYWAEKPNLPRSPDLRPLAGSIVELRETVQEHVTFDHLDVVYGLRVICLGSTSQWPQATMFSHVLSSPMEGPDFVEITTLPTSSADEKDMTRDATPPYKMESEN